MIACEMVVSVFVLTVLKLILVPLRNAKCNVHANGIMALYINYNKVFSGNIFISSRNTYVSIFDHIFVQVGL